MEGWSWQAAFQVRRDEDSIVKTVLVDDINKKMLCTWSIEAITVIRCSKNYRLFVL